MINVQSAHGGPIAQPEDAGFILRSCRTCHGFYGASSMERLPAERAIADTTRRFKAMSLSAATGGPN